MNNLNQLYFGFAYYTYYPSGGLGDLQGIWTDFETARAHMLTVSGDYAYLYTFNGTEFVEVWDRDNEPLSVLFPGIS